MLFTFLLWLVVLLPLTLLGIPILAVAILFMPPVMVGLPKSIKWFDNWGKEYPAGYWARFTWMALRNPVNYFQYSVLGMPTTGTLVQTMTNKNYFVSDKGHGGLLEQEVKCQETGKTYYEVYYVKPYMVFGRKLAIRARIGHKIGTHMIDPYASLPPVIQWVFSINPFQPYTGYDL